MSNVAYNISEIKAIAFTEFANSLLEKAIATRNYCEIKSLVTTELMYRKAFLNVKEV